MTFKPTLACEADLSNLKFPLFASPKLDGIRCSIVGGKALTRTLKEVPNRDVFSYLSLDAWTGLDGELIVGDPTDPDVYRNTVSGIMSRDGMPGFNYYVFDNHTAQGGWQQRFEALQEFVGPETIQVLEHEIILNHDDLIAYESARVDEGYEGVILRHPDAPYKFGRSTAKEGYLMKVKRFVDSEAVVIGVEEEMFNGNEATTNELGRTKRSTAKAGLVPKGRMGKLHVRDLTSGVEFHIGTGFTDADKAWWWAEDRTGLLVKYKSFPVGVKSLPRHPVYLGLRDLRDL